MAATHYEVAPARERGLKYNYLHKKKGLIKVAPARERGLKFNSLVACCAAVLSLPRGSVD